MLSYMDNNSHGFTDDDCEVISNYIGSRSVFIAPHLFGYCKLKFYLDIIKLVF